MEEKQVFSTPFGEAWLWGPPPTPDRPLVLVLEGAFSIPRPRGFELPGLLPEASVLNAHLPGNHCPEPVSHSVGVYAALYDDVLRQIGRPAVVAGVSIGALTAMAMRSPLIQGRVLSEPPLLTEKLWPLANDLRTRAARRPDGDPVRAFIWTVFGVAPDRTEPRDYRPLLAALDRPAWVLLGGEPLNPPRALDQIPSLVDEPERAAFAAHPGVRVRIVPEVGHNVPGRAITYVRTCVRELLNRQLGTPIPAGLAEVN